LDSLFKDLRTSGFFSIWLEEVEFEEEKIGELPRGVILDHIKFQSLEALNTALPREISVS